MSWKEFIKISWSKIGLTFLFIAINIVVYLWKNRPPLFTKEDVVISNIPTSSLIYTFSAYTYTLQFIIYLTFVALSSTYWYVISCLIVWIYSKVKK